MVLILVTGLFWVLNASGGLGNNMLDRTDRGTVHGGNLVIIESGRVSPFIHCVPVCRRSRMYCTHCRMCPTMTVHTAGIRTESDRASAETTLCSPAHGKNYRGRPTTKQRQALLTRARKEFLGVNFN